MNSPDPHEEAASVRLARFSVLPERIAFEDLVEEKPATTANQAVDAFEGDSSGTRFACLVADLGL